MEPQRKLEPWIWVLIPLIFAPLLGVTHRPRGVDQAMNGASTALRDGSPLGAARHLSWVAAALPWRDSLWEQAGQSALEGGDFDAAIQYLETAAATGHITPRGHASLGDAYRARGAWDAAIRNWEAALAGGVAPGPLHTRLLEAHRALKDYPAAIADLQALAALDPDNAATHYQLGLLLVAREPEAGLSYLLRAAELDDTLLETVRAIQHSLQPALETDNPAYALLNAGRALASLNEWELAAEAFRQAIAANPGFAEAWAFLGEAQQQLGQDGTDALGTALSLAPESLTANLLTGLYFQRQGDPVTALIYLETADRLAPDNAAIVAQMAGVQAALGDINAAIAGFARAIELAPEDPSYLHLLAFYSIHNDIQIDEIGLPAARKAVIMNGEDPIALDLVGYALHLGGDPASALRFFFRALQANPGYAPARFHLGLAYLAQGRVELAVQQFNLAIELAPDSLIAEQARSLLEHYVP